MVTGTEVGDWRTGVIEYSLASTLSKSARILWEEGLVVELSGEAIERIEVLSVKKDQSKGGKYLGNER